MLYLYFFSVKFLIIRLWFYIRVLANIRIAYAIYNYFPEKSYRKYLVSNNTMLIISKSNNYDMCQQKITTLLTNERHVLVDSYF